MAALPPNPELEFSFPIDVTQLPATGRDYTLNPKDAALRRIAQRLDLLELPELSAVLNLAPAAGGLIQLTGRIHARVVQACVVTLEPIAAEIAEDVAITYSRAPSKTAADVDLSDEDEPPEVIQGDVLDLGEAVVEQLALFIDPYPRAPGAVFKAPKGAEDRVEKAVVSPFAALAKLKSDKKSN